MTEQQFIFDEGHFQDRCLPRRNLFFSTCSAYFTSRCINEKTVESTYVHMVLQVQEHGQKPINRCIKNTFSEIMDWVEPLHFCQSLLSIFLVTTMDFLAQKCRYSVRVSPQMANRMVESARGILNKFLPDIYIYTDHMKGVNSGK